MKNYEKDFKDLIQNLKRLKTAFFELSIETGADLSNEITE